MSSSSFIDSKHKISDNQPNPTEPSSAEKASTPNNSQLDQKNNETLLLPVSINALICPIYHEIFYDAVSLGCGHHFERDAITTWCGAKDNVGCPVCKKPISGINEAPFMNDLVQTAIKADPSLEDKRHFPVSFKYSIHDLDAGLNKQDHKRLGTIVKYLKKSPETLNAVSDEEKFKGKSAVTVLASHRLGLEKIRDDKLLRSLISEKGLNAISEARDKGMTALHYFAMSPVGIQILDQDPVLVSKISVKGFNSFKKVNHYDHECAAELLIRQPDGAKLFFKYRTLITKIENTILEDYYLLYELSKHEEFATLFGEGDGLIEKISRKVLNTVFFEGANDSFVSSMLFNLMRHEKGRLLFLSSDHLIGSIDFSTLLGVIPDGEYQGKSPYHVLLDSWEGKEILKRLKSELSNWWSCEGGECRSYINDTRSYNTVSSNEEEPDSDNPSYLNVKLHLVAPNFSFLESPKLSGSSHIFQQAPTESKKSQYRVNDDLDAVVRRIGKLI